MKRSHDSERMDDPSIGNELLAGALKSIDRAHWLFSTFRDFLQTLNAVEFPSEESIRILDVGAGSGYLGQYLEQHLDDTVTYVSVDHSFRILDLFSKRSSVPVQARAPNLPFRDKSFDVVVSSLTLHHVSDENLVPFLRKSHELARSFSYHVDLLRNELAFGTLWMMSRLISTNTVFQQDAPHSVRRSLSFEEWQSLTRYPELEPYTISGTRPFVVQLSTHTP